MLFTQIYKDRECLHQCNPSSTNCKLDCLVDTKVASEVSANVARVELCGSLGHDHDSSRAFRAGGNGDPSDSVAHRASTDLFPIR